MDWIEEDANWKQVAGKLKEKWSVLTDEDFQFIDRNKEALVAKVFGKTGLARDTAERQIDAVLASLATPAALEKPADDTVRFPPPEQLAPEKAKPGDPNEFQPPRRA